MRYLNNTLKNKEQFQIIDDCRCGLSAVSDSVRRREGAERTLRYTDGSYKDYLINTTGRSPQWNFCIPLSELQTNLGITADDNNPDPTGFTGEPQVVE